MEVIVRNPGAVAPGSPGKTSPTRSSGEGFKNPEVKYLSLSDAARLYGVRPATLSQWVAGGEVGADLYDGRWMVRIVNGALEFKGRIPFTPIPPEGYYPIAEAAKKLGVSRQRVHALVQAGRFPGVVRSRGPEGRIGMWIPLEKTPPRGQASPEPVDLPPPGETLSPDEAAAQLGISRFSLRLLLHSNRIPGARKVGGEWIIPKNFAILDARGNVLSGNQPIPDGWVLVSEAAELLGVSEYVIRSRARAGGYGAIKYLGRWYVNPHLGGQPQRSKRGRRPQS